MKNIISFLLIAILVFNTCKENEPTAPKEETPQEVLAEATIGAEGGILQTEDFEVSIPPGAFMSSNKIVIEEEVDSAYTTSNVTSTFKIDGIPNGFANKIRIALKHDGNLSNENFIAIGEKSVCRSLGRAITSYVFIEAKDSAGYLVANLTTPNYSSSNDISLTKISNVWRWIYAVGISNIIALQNAEGHFRFIYESGTVTPMQFATVATKFENAYSVFLNRGFNYDKRNKWPIPIILKNIESEPGYITNGYYTGSSFLEDHGYIVINLEILDRDEKLSVVIGHEFLHLIQGLYDPRTWEEKRTSFSRQYWLDEATAVFSEEFFANDPEYYISGSFLISPISPFIGFHSEGNKAGNHGYGMASAIKYLNNRFLSSSLINYYRDIEFGKHPVEAIIFNANETTDWVHDYFQKLIQGDIYNIAPSYWIDNVVFEKTFLVDSKDDTLKNYNIPYPDLSGGLFNIKIQYQGWKDNTKIYFTLIGEENQNSEISVYKYNESNSFEFINSDITRIVVPDLDDLAEDGWNFLGLVTNRLAISPFTDKTNSNLQIDIKEPLDVAKNYKTAYIDLHVKGFHIRTTADTSFEDQYYEFYETYSPGQIGSLSGTTFSSSWSDSREEDYPEDGTIVTWYGSINIVFSEDFQEIISYTETNAEDWPGWRTTTMGVSVKNIPFYEGDEWSGDTYLLQVDEETCNNIVSRSYNLTWWDGSSLIFSRNECDEGSYIKIMLYE